MKSPSQRYVLAVDGGGSMTRCAVASLNGKPLGYAEGLTSNGYSAGFERAEANLLAACQQALHAAALHDSMAQAAHFGLAGAGREAERAEWRRRLAHLAHSVTVGHDAEIALLGAVYPQQHGVIVLAGTGSVVYGRSHGGREQRADGWGPVLGDSGGAYRLGRSALRAIMAAHDRIDEDTALTESVLDHLRLSSPEDLVAWASSASVEQIAKLAPLVINAAGRGDTKANEFVTRAAHHLAKAARTVLRRLDMAGVAAPVVLGGGLLTRAELLRQRVIAALVERAPRVRIQEPRLPAVAGAVIAALSSIGIEPDLDPDEWRAATRL